MWETSRQEDRSREKQTLSYRKLLLAPPYLFVSGSTQYVYTHRPTFINGMKT